MPPIPPAGPPTDAASRRPADPFGGLARLAQAAQAEGEQVEGVLTVPLDVRALAVPNAQVPSVERHASTIRLLAAPDSKEEDE